MWDLAFRIDGTAVEIDVTARFVPGSKPAVLDTFAKADLAALARSVPDEGPMMFAAAIDMSKFWAAMAPMIDSGLAVYPSADREKMKKVFEASRGRENPRPWDGRERRVRPAGDVDGRRDGDVRRRRLREGDDEDPGSPRH